MAKSQFEKQIEKQMKQEKRLADKKRREETRMERKAIIRERASSIVNGSSIIEGVRIMDKTAEEVLRCLLDNNTQGGSRVCFTDDIFPDYVQMSIGVELEKLTQYGMIGGLISYDNGGMLNLLPPAFSYFDDKEQALEKQKRNQEELKMRSIVNYGNIVFGDVSGSTLSVDNSIHEIERAIEEHGGDDKAELYELLDEVKELIENIQISRSIPKQKKLFQKLSDHMAKHGWFYGAVVQLLGTAAFGMLGA